MNKTKSSILILVAFFALAFAPVPAAAQSATDCIEVTYNGGFPACAQLVGSDDWMIFAPFGGYAAYQSFWYLLDWYLEWMGF